MLIDGTNMDLPGIGVIQRILALREGMKIESRSLRIITPCLDFRRSQGRQEKLLKS